MTGPDLPEVPERGRPERDRSERGVPHRDRRAELLAAAVDDSLTAREAAELDSLRAADPSIDSEIADLRALVTRSSLLGGWDRSEPTDALRARVLAVQSEATDAADQHSFGMQPADAGDQHSFGMQPGDVRFAGGAAELGGAKRHPSPARRRPRAMLIVSAAACLLIGATVGTVIGAAGSRPPSAPEGPPGTLGAVEQIDFSGIPVGSDIDGELVAHTWGTETVLRVDGLPAERSYSVVLVGTDGDRFDSGTFFGSTVTINCRMNAAVMRRDVDTVEIEDAAGRVIAEAQLPDAS